MTDPPIPKHLQDQRPIYHVSKYIQVINKANESLIKYALFSSLHKHTFIIGEPGLSLKFLVSLVLWLKKDIREGLGPGLALIPSYAAGGHLHTVINLETTSLTLSTSLANSSPLPVSGV